jgi:hypothetical protein
MRKIAIFILFFALLAHGANAQTSSASMEQLAQTLAKGLKSEKAKGKQIRLDYFTLDETQMGSVFSSNLYTALATELGKNGMAVRENPNDLNKQRTLAPKDQWVVCGVFTEQKGQILVHAALYDISQKKNIATAKGGIATVFLTKAGISWKPQQFENAQRTRNLIVDDDDAPQPEPKPAPDPAPAPKPTPEPTPSPEASTGDFKLDVMTSKGFGHQIFNEGERMQIAVRSKRPCFLRLVYHAADGQKVLLLENEPMKTSEEGNYITVPQEFECAAPFGIETLQLFACTEIFPPLRTHKDGGFIFIDDEIASINTKTRSFKPVSGNAKGLLRAEVRIQVTTLAKSK